MMLWEERHSPCLKDEEDNTALDVSQDLTLTDDSDLESSPVKKTKKKQTKILKTPVPKAPKESISFDCLKKFPLTPKENFNIHKVDVSSPKGISELLKSRKSTAQRPKATTLRKMVV